MKNELKHYGILGMRWGHKRMSNITTKISKTQDRLKKELDSGAPYEKSGVKSKHGKTLLTEKDVKELMSGLKKNASSEMAKYEFKMKKIQAKMNRTASKELQEQVATMTKGQVFKETFLRGSIGAKVYRESKITGYSKNASIVRAMLAKTPLYKTVV